VILESTVPSGGDGQGQKVTSMFLKYHFCSLGGHIVYDENLQPPD
jgi:hypothetical protein